MDRGDVSFALLSEHYPENHFRVREHFSWGVKEVLLTGYAPVFLPTSRADEVEADALPDENADESERFDMDIWNAELRSWEPVVDDWNHEDMSDENDGETAYLDEPEPDSEVPVKTRRR